MPIERNYWIINTNDANIRIDGGCFGIWLKKGYALTDSGAGVKILS